MTSTKRLLITGGAGFIGSQLVRTAIAAGYHVTVLDSLTYAGSLENLRELDGNPLLSFVHGDICDTVTVGQLVARGAFAGILHLAAESHVDNSIAGPAQFIQTNLVGTFTLLEAARKAPEALRFLHVSTDEVFGSLGPAGYFTEESNYQPNSPYSASKAGSDHLVRAWHHTYGLDTVTTNCSNNYGPRQYPEKLIPLCISNALKGKPLPVYGDGLNRRDWIHVEDHCRGILLAFEKGRAGETYCFGGQAEQSNLEVVRGICEALSALPGGAADYTGLIKFVTDRPGHDRRYSIDSAKAERELGFRREYGFGEGLRGTVRWYADQAGRPSC